MQIAPVVVRPTEGRGHANPGSCVETEDQGQYTRLTNAFSKKVENHAAAVALLFIHYNFARIHKTLRITPALAAGLSDHVWSYEEIASLAG